MGNSEQGGGTFIAGLVMMETHSCLSWVSLLWHIRLQIYINLQF